MTPPSLDEQIATVGLIHDMLLGARFKKALIDSLTRLKAMDSLARASVPEGCAVVPREPTEAMIKAGSWAWEMHNHGEPYTQEIPDIYKAMLASANQVKDSK